MFNVYPVMLHYKVTKARGVLAGIPCDCSFGEVSVAAAKCSQAMLEKRSAEGPDRYHDFRIVSK